MGQSLWDYRYLFQSFLNSKTFLFNKSFYLFMDVFATCWYCNEFLAIIRCLMHRSIVILQHLYIWRIYRFQLWWFLTNSPGSGDHIWMTSYSMYVLRPFCPGYNEQRFPFIKEWIWIIILIIHVVTDNNCLVDCSWRRYRLMEIIHHSTSWKIKFIYRHKHYLEW